MVDFHTHHHRQSMPYLLSAARPLAGTAVSLEFHPWQSASAPGIPEDFAAKLTECAALGEIGLDRLRGAEMTVQQKIFGKLLEIGAAQRKPVVIHCVRAVPEVIRMCAGYPAPRLIHGFRGRVRILEEFLAAGFYVSLSVPALSSPEIGKFLRRNGLWHIGFESDEVPETGYIAAFRQAAAVWDIPDMAGTAEKNFREFLGMDEEKVTQNGI